jgi:hypothetical protein
VWCETVHQLRHFLLLFCGKQQQYCSYPHVRRCLDLDCNEMKCLSFFADSVSFEQFAHAFAKPSQVRNPQSSWPMPRVRNPQSSWPMPRVMYCPGCQQQRLGVREVHTH